MRTSLTTTFSEANWDADWVALRDRLGDPAVKPFQIREWLLAEAVVAGTMNRFLRGALLRELNYKLPDGWGPGDDRAVRAAWAVWAASLGDDATEAAAEVSRALKTFHPPAWKPTTPDDPTLVSALRDFPTGVVRSPLVGPTGNLAE